MEEHTPTDTIDNQETVAPSPPSPAIEIPDDIGTAARSVPEGAAKRPPLAKRLTEAFQEGMASARPDGRARSETAIPSRTRAPRAAADEPGIVGKVLQGGGSALAGVGDIASGALDLFVELVKKTPDLTQKYVEAFRSGSPSGKQGESTTGTKSSAADSRVMLERVWQAGESAVGFVREAVSVVKPGEVIGARQKIRLLQKKINQLYCDIGAEAFASWSDGLVETEKLTALLEEVQKQEQEIAGLETRLAEAAAAGQAARKEAATRRPKPVKKKEAAPPADQDQSAAEPVVVESPAGAAEAAAPEYVADDAPATTPVDDATNAAEPDAAALPVEPALQEQSEEQLAAQAVPHDTSADGSEPATEETADALHSAPADQSQADETGENDEREKGNDGK